MATPTASYHSDMTSKSLFCSALLCLLLSLPAKAAPGAAALDKFLQNVQSFSAAFTQIQSDEQGQLMQSSTGQVWLQRSRGGEDAGRFRWNYVTPYKQEIVCDGQKIWLYDPDLAQVTVRPAAEALSGTPAALLSLRKALTEDFLVTEGGVEAGQAKLMLKPRKADGEYRQIEIWFSGELPARLRFEDPLGGSTDMTFSNTQANPSLKSAQFEFVPPKGVEVVEAGGP